MTKADLVVVRTFHETFAANLAQSALTAAGIRSMLRSDEHGRLRPNLHMIGRGIELIVRAADEREALDVLDTVPRDVPQADRTETD
jgi:Putative prokaryotic signal transducing protein